MYTGKFRNRAPTTSPYSRKSFSMNGSGFRIRGNPLNGPRGPGAVRPARALDFDGAVGCATVEGLIVGACSEDIAVLQTSRFGPEINRPAGPVGYFMYAALFSGGLPARTSPTQPQVG